MSSTLPGAECVGIIIDEKFSLLQWLGGTRHSSVYRTQLHMDPPRDAILKLIPERAVDTEALTAQWETARTLTHPNLVQLFNSGRCEINGKQYFFAVTEYAEELLSEVLPTRPLTTQEVSDMLTPVLDALSYLHIRHLAHAAFKPSNIMVVGDTLKLSVDSVHREEHPPSIPRKTRSGANTPEASIYHAPELATEAPTRAADMWSLGVLLVQALTQKLLILQSSRATNPVVPNLPEPYLRIARACLNIDPAARCTLGDVHSILHPSPAIPAPTQNAAPPLSPSQAKRRYRFYVVVAVVLAAIGGGIAALVSMDSRHAQPSPAQIASEETQPSSTPVTPEAGAPSSSAQQTQTTPSTTSQKPEAQAPPPQPPAPVQSEQPAVTPPSTQAAVSSGAVVHQVLPDAPQSALRTIRGHVPVTIRVQVDNAGNVEQASIAERGPSQYFAHLALEASHKWTFLPSPGAWLLHYTFAQSGVDASAEPVAQ